MAGKTFGRYRLVRLLARGGMAEVYLAVLTGAAGFEKRLALKKILPTFEDLEEFTQLFTDEARISVTLNHSHIVQTFDFGVHNGEYFIAMEYVDGPDLEKLLMACRKLHRQMAIDALLYVATRTAAALEYAHSRIDERGRSLEIIHRDISPPNILMSVQGDIKLTDFGVARYAQRISKSRPGVVRGKYAYMSPEQLKGEDLDSRSDIFSFGSVLYEMLTGVNPFLGETDYQTMEAVVAASPKSPLDYRSNAPRDLVRIIKRSMAPLADDRYQHAGELRRDLAELMFNRGVIDDPALILDEMWSVFPRQMARRGAVAPKPRPVAAAPPSSASVGLPSMRGGSGVTAREEWGGKEGGPTPLNDEDLYGEDDLTIPHLGNPDAIPTQPIGEDAYEEDEDDKTEVGPPSMYFDESRGEVSDPFGAIAPHKTHPQVKSLNPLTPSDLLSGDSLPAVDDAAAEQEDVFEDISNIELDISQPADAAPTFEPLPPGAPDPSEAETEIANSGEGFIDFPELDDPPEAGAEAPLGDLDATRSEGLEDPAAEDRPDDPSADDVPFAILPKDAGPDFQETSVGGVSRSAPGAEAPSGASDPDPASDPAQSAADDADLGQTEAEVEPVQVKTERSRAPGEPDPAADAPEASPKPEVGAAPPLLSGKAKRPSVPPAVPKRPASGIRATQPGRRGPHRRKEGEREGSPWFVVVAAIVLISLLFVAMKVMDSRPAPLDQDVPQDVRVTMRESNPPPLDTPTPAESPTPDEGDEEAGDEGDPGDEGVATDEPETPDEGATPELEPPTPAVQAATPAPTPRTTPAPKATPKPTPTPTPTPEATPQPTPTPSATPQPTPTPSATPEPTPARVASKNSIPLTVRSDPAGAALTVDGKRVGNAPWAGTAKPGAIIEVTARKEGYLNTTRILRVGKKPLEAVVELSPSEAEPVKMGTVAITSTPWAYVSVDGRILGQVTPVRLDLAPGQHTIVLENPEVSWSVERSVLVQAGKVVTVDVRK